MEIEERVDILNGFFSTGLLYVCNFQDLMQTFLFKILDQGWSTLEDRVGAQFTFLYHSKE